jgi:hypothetical protein
MHKLMMEACLLLAAGCGSNEAGVEEQAAAPDAAEEQAPAQPAAAADAAAEDPTAWLTGTWVLTEDPLNKPTDWFVFTAPDVATMRTPDGREIAGTYSIRGEELLLKFPMGERTFQIRLQISFDRTRLTNSAGGYYTRS